MNNVLDLLGSDSETDSIKELLKLPFDIYAKCKLLVLSVNYLERQNIEFDKESKEEAETIANDMMEHIYEVENKASNQQYHLSILFKDYKKNFSLINKVINKVRDSIGSDLMKTPVFDDEKADSTVAEVQKSVIEPKESETQEELPVEGVEYFDKTDDGDNETA